METITNHWPTPKISLFQHLLALTKWILWLWVKGRRERCFCASLFGPCVWHRGLKTVQKKRKGWVTTSIRCKRGVNWHRLLAQAQCMVGRQHQGASRHREKMLGAKPTSQWGLWGWWKGDQIRRRGENWDRFSCRCWDNRRTNDLIEHLGENWVWEGLQRVGMEVQGSKKRRIWIKKPNKCKPE